MRSIAIFGATGSVGQNALHVVERLASDLRVTVLTAWTSATALAAAAVRFRPAMVVIGDPREYEALKRALPAGYSGEVAAGPTALVEAAGRDDVDVVLNAITGAAGLPVTLAAVTTGKRLALANKESLVAGGPLVMEIAARTGAEIIPVDSEHSAIFQALRAGRRSEVRRLILTGSGGPFRTRPRATFADVTIADALKHPTWSMGPKITVDSASMMNKALEIVEARWLFDVPASMIDVVVHPQSVVHSMILFRDSSVVAQMGRPDMRTPIQYAITHPDRLESDVDAYSPQAFSGLTFEAPDLDKFPSIAFGFRAAESGGLLGAVLNGANECAVGRFLAGTLPFPAIFDTVGRALDAFRGGDAVTIESILDADAWARRFVDTAP